MKKKVLVIGVSIIIGGIIVSSVKKAIDMRKERLEGAIEENEF